MEKYIILMSKFLKGELSAEEFSSKYLSSFKLEKEGMDIKLFEVLNDIFEAADSYWPDCLPGQETEIEISEVQLITEVKEAMEKLNSYQKDN